jgi:hypothetical protein
MPKQIFFTLFIAFIFLSHTLFGQEKTVTYLYDPSWQAPGRVVDIRHMTADISIDPYDTVVKGVVEFEFKILRAMVDSIVFYAPDIEPGMIRIGKLETGWRRSGNDLVVQTGPLDDRDEVYKIEMDYEARPGYGLFMTGWSEPDIRKRKQVWAHRPFHWLPYYSDRLTVDMSITFDDGYEVCSNGIRKQVKNNNNGTTTWRYVMEKEHPFFSTALAIGEYAWKEFDSGTGVPLEYWYYPDQEDHFEPTYRFSKEMFSFLEEEFSFPYPYPLYRNIPVQDYLYGAMETTTSTIFGDYMHVDSAAFDGRNYVNVNAHELVHQWFGNCLSHIRGKDLWLTESFATYYAKIFEREVFGDDYYQEERLEEAKDAFEASGKDRYPVGHGKGGRARWYPKGSLVLDMMRDVMGEDEFKASIKRYLEDNAFSEVETGDFLAAIREATGRPMEWFFDQWIYRGGEPEYKVGWEIIADADQNHYARVMVEQVHQMDDLTGLFQMPFDIDLYFEGGGHTTSRHWISEKKQYLDIPVQKENLPLFIIWDPNQKVLKKLQFNRSIDELSMQALMAEHMIDRYEALVTLREYPLVDKRDVLLQVYEHEGYHLTKGEVLGQLAGNMDDDVLMIMEDALQSDDVYLRRAALEALPVIPAELQLDVEAMLTGQSYINTEIALRKLVISFPKEYGRYLEKTKNMKGWRGRNIRMAWLEVALQYGQREYLRELVNYAGPGYGFETRINAFKLLRKLNYMDYDAARNLCHGAVYWNYKVRNAALDVIKYFAEQTDKRYELKYAVDRGPWSGKEREKLGKILEDF